MKNAVLFCLLTILFGLNPGHVLADNDPVFLRPVNMEQGSLEFNKNPEPPILFSGFGVQLSMGFPNIGWNTKDDAKRTVSVWGFNIASAWNFVWAPGIAFKGYIFYQKINEISFTYGVGTIGGFYPYVGLGGEYIWSNGFMLGLGVNGYSYVPSLGYAAVWPEIRLGYNF